MDEEMGIEMQENVQQIMQDRFGMTLPSLRKPDNSLNQNAPSDIEPLGRMEPKELALILQRKPNEQNENTTKTEGSSNNNNLNDILKNMPPHVRAIAERRPDLVSRIMSEMQHPHNGADTSLNPISEDQQDIFDESEEGDITYDSEYVGLLRRRTNNNNR